jgi:hypothetical protein
MGKGKDDVENSKTSHKKGVEKLTDSHSLFLKFLPYFALHPFEIKTIQSSPTKLQSLYKH